MKALAVVVTVLCCGIFVATAGAAPPQAGPADVLAQGSAFDQVAAEFDSGRLTRKQAVLLQARLLFAPSALSRSEARLTASRQTVSEPCLTWFFSSVQAVYDELTPTERDELAAMDPNLEAIMRGRAAASLGRHVSALPTIPLDKLVAGGYCDVHYTLTGPNAAPSETFAKLTAQYIDEAYEAETYNLAMALPEGTNGKLQVYICATQDNISFWTNTTPWSAGNGKQYAGYITIGNPDKAAAKGARAALRATCYHEYFHGVQAAYNAQLPPWFLEGSATWAQSHYTGDYASLQPVLNAPESCCRAPWRPLWDTTYHKYTTVVFVYHLANQYGGEAFIKSWLQDAWSQDDAILVLKDLLRARGSSLEEQFKQYTWALYTRQIDKIKPYMPKASRISVYTYGAHCPWSVRQTGITYYRLNRAKGIDKATLLMNFVPGSAGSPQAYFITSTSPKKLQPLTNSSAAGVYPEWVASFGEKGKTVVVVVYDAGYASQDPNERKPVLDMVTPHCVIHSVTAQSPVRGGDTVKARITYSLLGTLPGKFPVEIRLDETGPGRNYSVSGDKDLRAGSKKTGTYECTTWWGMNGTYKFTFEFRVPCKAWADKYGGPQTSCSDAVMVVMEGCR